MLLKLGCCVLLAIGLILPVLAQTEECATCVATVSPLASISTQPALRGVVTLIDSNGLFNINIGAREQVPNGAHLLVLRQGTPIAEAQVRKVNDLDAVAALLQPACGVRLQSGDLVVVSLLAPGDGTARPCAPRGALPWYEPAGITDEDEDFWTAVVLIAIGIAVID